MIPKNIDKQESSLRLDVASCSVLLNSPNWIGGSELSTILWLIPFWVFFGIFIWKWLGQSLDRVEGQPKPAEESKPHYRRDGEDKHSDCDNTNKYSKTACDLVEYGMHLDGLMLHQPRYGNVQGHCARQQNGHNRSSLPESGTCGVLNDGSYTDSTDPVAICGNSIHMERSEQESLFLAND